MYVCESKKGESRTVNEQKKTNAQNLEMLQQILDDLIRYANEAVLMSYQTTQEERNTFGEIVRQVNGMNMWL